MVKYKSASKGDESSLDQVFSALSDSTRRRIVHMLAEQELCVTDLASCFDMSLVAVSKHLKILERANIIQRRIDGRTHYLTLKPEQLTGALDWIAIYRNFWNQRLDKLEQLEE